MQQHNGGDYFLGCECDACNQFRAEAKELGVAPFDLAVMTAESIAAKILFLDKGMPAHLLIEFADRGESLVRGLAAWPDDDWNFTTVGQELHNRGLPQIGAVFGNHLPSMASAPLRPSQAPMWGAGSCGGGRINAPIMNTASGTDETVSLTLHRQRIGRATLNRTISLTSPLAMQMMLHFYAVRERYIPAPVSTWPPAQRAIVEAFMLKGLIREQDREDYVTTDKGDLIVATLKAVMTESMRHV